MIYRVKGSRFFKIRGDFLAVPVMRIVVFWGLYSCLPVFGKLPYIPAAPIDFLFLLNLNLNHAP